MNPHVLRCTSSNIGMAMASIFLLCQGCSADPVETQAQTHRETRVVIERDGWQLVGDLLLPASEEPLPGVLMLNKAAGDRTVYQELAQHLAGRRIASLRLDLPGHGESINLGRFIPGEQPRSPMIWDSEVHVSAAHQYLRSHPRIAGERIGIVGASYSGEEMAEAGREFGYAQAYVALSPGSFSDESIRDIDSSGIPWLFITSKSERFLREITETLQDESQTVELLIVPGVRHASDILEAHPGMSERIAIWLAHRLANAPD